MKAKRAKGLAHNHNVVTQYPKEITVSDVRCILFTPTIDLDLTDDNEAGAGGATERQPAAMATAR